MKRESSHSSHICFVSVTEESHVHSSLILDCMLPWPLWLVIVSCSSFDDSQILSGLLNWDLSDFSFINNLEFSASKRKDTEGKSYLPYQIKTVSYQQDVTVDINLDLLAEAAHVSLLYGGVSYSAPLKLLHSQYKDTELHLSQDNGSVETVWYSSV